MTQFIVEYDGTAKQLFGLTGLNPLEVKEQGDQLWRVDYEQFDCGFFGDNDRYDEEHWSSMSTHPTIVPKQALELYDFLKQQEDCRNVKLIQGRTLWF